MIQHLIFDFGGVLLESDFPYLLNLITDNEEERKEFSKVVFSKEFTEQLDRGHKSSAELFTILSEKHPALAPLIRQFQTRWMEHLKGEMPGMYALLKNFQQRGLHLYGLSNWSDMIYEVMEIYPIFQLLEGAVISSEEHVTKPDAAIYEILLSRYHLDPSECIFIDDKEENVTAATKLGMTGVQFINATQLYADLATLTTPVEV